MFRMRITAYKIVIFVMTKKKVFVRIHISLLRTVFYFHYTFKDKY